MAKLAPDYQPLETGHQQLKAALSLFRALGHAHASALISTGLDVMSVGTRLGHASPALTLTICAHLFHNRDDDAAAIDAVLHDRNGK